MPRVDSSSPLLGCSFFLLPADDSVLSPVPNAIQYETKELSAVGDRERENAAHPQEGRPERQEKSESGKNCIRKWQEDVQQDDFS